MEKTEKIYKVISKASGAVLILLVAVRLIMGRSTIIAIFRMELSFYIGLLFVIFFLSLAGGKIARSRKAFSVILAIVLAALAVVSGIMTFSGIKERHLRTGIVSDDGSHTIYKLRRRNLLNQSADDYYIKSGPVTYRFLFDSDPGHTPKPEWGEDGLTYRGKFYSYK